MTKLFELNEIVGTSHSGEFQTSQIVKGYTEDHRLQAIRYLVAHPKKKFLTSTGIASSKNLISDFFRWDDDKVIPPLVLNDGTIVSDTSKLNRNQLLDAQNILMLAGVGKAFHTDYGNQEACVILAEIELQLSTMMSLPA